MTLDETMFSKSLICLEFYLEFLYIQIRLRHAFGKSFGIRHAFGISIIQFLLCSFLHVLENILLNYILC